MLKQVTSLILPLTVLILVPRWIEPDLSIGSTPSVMAGSLLVATGLCCMVLTIAKFTTRGMGTLAPWSPTKKLVVEGLHAYVRNPMILGVLTVLLGEALIVQSTNILAWAVIFFFINTTWFILYEEPDLEIKFGEPYRKYKQKIHRWIPRMKPYDPEQAN